MTAERRDIGFELLIAGQRRFPRAAVGAAVIVLIVPVVLFIWGLPRLLEGIGLEHSLNAADAAVFENASSREAYELAAHQLVWISPQNGDGLVLKAEMLALGAGSRSKELDNARILAIAGLEHAPANPRGWTILCELDAKIALSVADQCMEIGFFIAPFDWYVARRRALLAAHLWPSLGPDVRNAAARRVKLMWESDRWDDHRVKQSIFEVYRAPNGPDLLLAGFKNDRDELSAVNRWLMQKQMYEPGQ